MPLVSTGEDKLWDILMPERVHALLCIRRELLAISEHLVEATAMLSVSMTPCRWQVLH